MSGRLFCLDSVLVDVVLEISAIPARSKDVRTSSQLITTGGGFNAMSAARRFGVPATYLGRLGEGPFGELARRSLVDEGVVEGVEKNRELDTGICIVLLEPDGERTFVTSAGAESTLRSSDLDAIDIGPEDCVLVSGYNVMYEGFADLVIAWLSQLTPGTSIFFDPATRAEDIPAQHLETMLRLSTWLLCNQSEVLLLANMKNARHAAEHVASRTPGLSVVARAGERGCVVVTDGCTHELDGYLTSVVDTNGAGDVHNGVFIAELLRGADSVSAADWANAAAAMAIARIGPATCPTREEVQTWKRAVSSR